MMLEAPFPLQLGLDLLPPLPPSAPFFAGALLLVLARRHQRLKQALLLLVPLVGALNLLSLESGSSFVWHVQGLDLVQLRVDRLSMLFGLLFHVGALIGVLYALKHRDTSEHVAALAYAGSALGAAFAGDLVTLFFYWEGMAVASAFLVWAGRTPESNGAGLRYLALHLLSGLLLLAGAVLHYQTTGDIAFDFIGAGTTAGSLILLGFGIKCGFPLFHNWITDAYPRSTPSGTVFLSMFTTKVAVYALARGFPGTDVLVPIGTAMAIFPIFYAVIENDLRRVLGYSMINQIGFMVVGVGLGTELALNGAVAHAFNEVLFKGLLFMSMGAVLLRVGNVLGSDIGGLYRSMPWTTVFCVVGAASISAFPLFNGFVSKSMIMAAMIDEGWTWAWLGLLFASAGVFHHAGIKIPYFAFFAHDAGIRVPEAPRNMLIAMAVAAVLCIAVGSWPGVLYGLLPWDAGYAPYTYPHVIVQVQLLLFSALAFAWLKLTGIYPPELRSVNLDAEWVYRRLLPRGLAGTAAALAGVRTAMSRPARGSAAAATRVSELVSGVARTGTAVLLVTLMLVAYATFMYLKT
jgi:multicomponent Na+:H+ antiporter subunit D